MSADKIEQHLGVNYNDRILKYLASETVIEYGYAPTWWITSGNGWRNKSYWVNKALKNLQTTQQVESFMHRRSIGLCWALTGKMKKRG